MRCHCSVFEGLLRDLVEDASELQERSSGAAFLKVACASYAISEACYIGLNIAVGPARSRYIQCTYSSEWVKHALTRHAVSPGRIELRLPPPRTAGTCSDAQHSGTRHARLLALQSLSGETAFLAFTQPGTARPEEVPLRDLEVLSNYFHRHILRIYGHKVEQDLALSARELDCLKWIAGGKTAWEVSVILGITERTVRFHLNAAREKLNCLTTTQAVAKAVSRQLIAV